MCKINGKKLGELRTTAGISRNKLAEKCGLSTTAIYNYETGKANPSDETAEKICFILNIDKNDITVHDVGYSFAYRCGKTENSLRKRKGFIRYCTPLETETYIAEHRTLSDEEEEKEVSICIKNAFGMGVKKYILINPTLIHIPEWQRDTDMAKTREIADNFNEAKFDPIKVYIKDGKAYVADGAHRLIAFIINGELKILVEILNCTELEATLIFLGQQTGRKNMTANDTYRAGVKANIEEYTSFKYLFESHNIQITSDYNKIKNPIGYIRPSSEIMRLTQSNSELVTSIINLCNELHWCGSEKNVFVLRTFKVMKKLYATYGEETVKRKLMSKCSGATYFESTIAPVKSNAEMYDILAKEINE